mmetsp:Transcript_62154/g.98882  ORF Transcript_62154/g.98882 Transcript_62154/m.98882 type:complete len:218 (+) Transcript_62154:598-1251(+)
MSIHLFRRFLILLLDVIFFLFVMWMQCNGVLLLPLIVRRLFQIHRHCLSVDQGNMSVDLLEKLLQIRPEGRMREILHCVHGSKPRLLRRSLIQQRFNEQHIVFVFVHSNDWNVLQTQRLLIRVLMEYHHLVQQIVVCVRLVSQCVVAQQCKYHLIVYFLVALLLVFRVFIHFCRLSIVAVLYIVDCVHLIDKGRVENGLRDNLVFGKHVRLNMIVYV